MADALNENDGVASRKLGALQERFQSFERTMEDETRRRREAEDSKLSVMRESMAKLEKTLNSEIKRRVEANKALQSMFESQIATVQDKLEAVFVEKLNHLQLAADELSDRMALVEKDFAVERDKYIRDLEEKNAVVAKDVNFLQDAFDNEKVKRADRDAGLQKRISEHEYRTETRFEQERAAREQKYQALRDELHQAKQVRAKGDEKFQTFILEEVASLKNGLVLESESREQADDDIVQALNHYTKALQDALRIVNQP
ncbi:unnamed protein product [Amoebophrya sp. A120]|nr:unnamed protein product [Amoebophrya sp. A120]|eukprot:GSA120T00003421001.1